MSGDDAQVEIPPWVVFEITERQPTTTTTTTAALQVETPTSTSTPTPTSTLSWTWDSSLDSVKAGTIL